MLRTMATEHQPQNELSVVAKSPCQIPQAPWASSPAPSFATPPTCVLQHAVARQDVSKDSIDKNEQSAYWYHRYSLRPLLDPQGHVALTPTGAPLFDVPLLLAETQETVLMTGKYLNAIRECGRTVERSLPTDVHVGESLALVMCTKLGDLQQLNVAHMAKCWQRD